MAKARVRMSLLFALCGIVSCGGLALGAHALFQWLDPFAAHRFDREFWTASEPKERASMARDAIRHLSPGMLETDIEPLLGKPDEVMDTHRLTKSFPRGAVRTYSYHLVGWSLLYYDSTFLWVHVGEDGRVIVAEIGGG